MKHCARLAFEQDKESKQTVAVGMSFLRRRNGSLRTHLVIFAFAIALPVILFCGLLLWRFTISERAANERLALDIARATSADVDREITGVTTILETLATSQLLASGDFTRFHAQAKAALRSQPWNVVLIDRSQQQLVNTRVPWGAPLPQFPDTAPPVVEIAQETRRPFVSDLFVEPGTQQPIFGVSVPVFQGEEVRYALVMSIVPERLDEILKEQSLPEGWLAAVSDRKNINIARSHLAQRFRGQEIPSETLERYGRRQEGVIITTDFEGRESLQAFHWSKRTGWRIAAWAPLAVVEAPLKRAWWLFLGSGSALLVLGIALAFGLGRLMARPIADLMTAGAALGQGKIVTPFASTVREASELSRVLSNASTELSARMGATNHLAAIVSSSASAIMSLSLNNIIQSWNPAATKLFGYPPSEAIGRSVRILYADEASEEFDTISARVRSGETVQQDAVRRRKDGKLIHVAVTITPMYSDNGMLIGFSSIVRDISERKEREKQIELLIRELSHRSKNLLAVIQAVAAQIALHSNNFEEFRARFAQRLQAISQSQDLLVGHQWQRAAVIDIVGSQLSPFVDIKSSHVEMQGPDLRLTAKAVYSISLALHELATNAVKYGALSVPDGKVTVHWRDGGRENGSRRFSMTWRESDGPPVSPPSRTGFGHVVIQHLVAESLNGEVAIDFAASGFSWRLDIPGAYIANTE
jgi:PAS domain S-box-containing protein